MPQATEEAVREAIRVVEDPELGINVVDLGLIYGLELEGSKVTVTMTLTSPGCPHGQLLLDQVKGAAGTVPGVSEVELKLSWTPFWTPEKISEEYKQILRWSGYKI